ncbi:MAG: VOC family protein [Nostoc sp. DedQUE01]|nr:glyoxalase [Nostoc sp. DedQUE11]MDZ8077134.1 glyoxalase [Nostoc sp. DedQUE01]MDZ8080736.1 glyoxalase [Nostoc sp. DcaGUA01]
MNKTLFHLTFPVTDLALAKTYYVDGLGCIPGRENRQLLILNLHGHQFVAFFTKETLVPQPIYPRHCGIVFSLKSDWEEVLSRAEQQNLTFRQKPELRFADSFIEHDTFFLEDPFYNLIEFKHYRHPEAIFGYYDYTQIEERV